MATVKVVLNIGIWCKRLFVSAALGCPEIVGWSGTKLRKESSSLLNVSTFSELIFRIWTGRRLNILAPFDTREASLALLTIAGPLDTK